MAARLVPTLLAALVLTLSACDGSSEPVSHGDHDAGAQPHEDDAQDGPMDRGDPTAELDLATSKASPSGAWMVSYASSTEGLPFNETFDVTVTVLGGEDHDVPAEGVTVTVDADMPAHGHGMNLTPETTPNGDGTWTAEGFLFHMPGHWQLLVAVDDEQVVFDLWVES